MSGTGDNNFRDISVRLTELILPDRSKWTTFKAGPEYYGPTKPKWSFPYLMYQPKFSEFWVEWKAPHVVLKSAVSLFIVLLQVKARKVNGVAL